MSDLAAALTRDGHFFTTAGHLFPTPKTVRPQTLSAFGLAYAHEGGSGDRAGEIGGSGNRSASATHAASSASTAATASVSSDGAVVTREYAREGGEAAARLQPLRFASRVEVTSALMGFSSATAAGRRAVHRVLAPMHACCLDRHGCLWPPGANGNANQRRDQSALNAALAAAAAALEAPSGAAEEGPPWKEPECWRDKRWWAWFGQATLEPPADEAAFDLEALRVFSRRAAEPKPYTRHLVLNTRHTYGF